MTSSLRIIMATSYLDPNLSYWGCLIEDLILICKTFWSFSDELKLMSPMRTTSGSLEFSDKHLLEVTTTDGLIIEPTDEHFKIYYKKYSTILAIGILPHFQLIRLPAEDHPIATSKCKILNFISNFCNKYSYNAWKVTFICFHVNTLPA